MNRIPFVVLDKIETEPPCDNKTLALMNFQKVIDDVKNGKEMVLDVDHAHAILNSECKYIYVDMDSACNTNASRAVAGTFRVQTRGQGIAQCGSVEYEKVFSMWESHYDQINQSIILPRELRINK